MKGVTQSSHVSQATSETQSGDANILSKEDPNKLMEARKMKKSEALTTELWAYIRDVMMNRWPGLSMRRMSQKAGLPSKTVGKIKMGEVPESKTLLALAERWGRSDEERQQDYHKMLELLAG